MITALLIVALAVTAAVGMAMRGQADIRRSSAVFERDLSREIALGAGFMVALALRAAGLWWGLSLPRYRARPGREVAEIEGDGEC